MHKKTISQICLILIVASLIGGYFYLQPKLVDREIRQLMVYVLENTKGFPSPEVLLKWESPKEAPPLYGIESFDIDKIETQMKDSPKTATVYLHLKFNEDTRFFTGPWICWLEKTSDGWKIKRLKAQTNPTLQ